MILKRLQISTWLGDPTNCYIVMDSETHELMVVDPAGEVDKIIEMIKYVNLNPTVTRNLELIFIVLRGPLSWLIIFIFIKILYTMAPDKNIPSKNVNYGATFTTIGWIIATSIYSYYIANYAHYNYFYGGLANIVILMLWVYLLAYILVIGMALNVQTEEERLAKTTKIKLSSLDQNNNGNDEDVSKN